MGGARQEDAARLGDAFQAHGDIDAFALDIVALDQDLAEVDADAEQHALPGGHAGIAPLHQPLDLDGAVHGADHRREFGEHAVAGDIDDSAPLPFHDRAQGGQVLAHAPRGALLVHPHEPAVTGDVGGEDRCKPALDPLL